MHDCIHCIIQQDVNDISHESTLRTYDNNKYHWVGRTFATFPSYNSNPVLTNWNNTFTRTSYKTHIHTTVKLIHPNHKIWNASHILSCTKKGIKMCVGACRIKLVQTRHLSLYSCPTIPMMRFYLLCFVALSAVFKLLW